MDIRKDLETLCDAVGEQIGDITRKIQNNGMSTGNLDTLDKLTHTLKSIKGVMAMMDEDGYSSRNRGSYRGGVYARRHGYARNDLADRMRELMDDAPDDRTRQDLQRMIEKLEA